MPESDQLIFVLVSDCETFLDELETGFKLQVVRMKFFEAIGKHFDDDKVVLVDIDTSRGLDVSYQISVQCPFCNIATVSTNRRPEDRLMNIRQPFDWTDLQVLLIRSGLFGAILISAF